MFVLQRDLSAAVGGAGDAGVRTPTIQSKKEWTAHIRVRQTTPRTDRTKRLTHFVYKLLSFKIERILKLYLAPAGYRKLFDIEYAFAK